MVSKFIRLTKAFEYDYYNHMIKQVGEIIEPRWVDEKPELIAAHGVYFPIPDGSWEHVEESTFYRGVNEPNPLVSELIQKITDLDPNLGVNHSTKNRIAYAKGFQNAVGQAIAAIKEWSEKNP